MNFNPFFFFFFFCILLNIHYTELIFEITYFMFYVVYKVFILRFFFLENCFPFGTSLGMVFDYTNQN